MARELKQVTFDLKSPQYIASKSICPSCKKAVNLNSSALLPCLHSACKDCIDNEKTFPQTGKLSRCPTCLEAVNIHRDFPVNFLMNEVKNKGILEQETLIQCESCDEETAMMHCESCLSFLCNFCATAHRRMNATKTHKMCSLEEFYRKSSGSFTRPCYCFSHRKKLLVFYCQSCKMAVCNECIFTSHDNHQLKKPELIYPDIKKQVISSLEELKNIQRDAEKSIFNIQNSVSRIQRHSNKLRNDIEEHFKKIIKAVNKRMNDILGDLSDRTESKLSKLKEQKIKLQHFADKTQYCCSFTEKALTNGSDIELISVSQTVLLRITQLHDEKITQPDITLIQNRELLTFKNESKELFETIDKAGFLDCSRPDTDVSRSFLDVTDIHVTQKVVSRFSVVAVNSQGLRQTFGGDFIKLRLIDSKTNDDIEGFKYSLGDHDNGQYTVAILVTRPGVYSLQVKLNGHPLKGSPLSVTVTPKDWIGSVRRLTGSFSSPHSVIISNHGNVMVADSHNHQIKILDSDGVLKHSIGGKRGNNQMELNFPYCIAMNRSGAILAISESQNNRVQLIDITSGKLQKIISQFETDTLCHPHGVAIDDNDCIFVADSGNSRIVVFSMRGEVLGKIMSQYISRPWGVALTRGGLIAVTDYNNHKVFVFEMDGLLKNQFGSRGGGNGQLNNPAGIAVDQDDQFIVADRSNHRVQIFQRDGTYVTKFGGKGTGDGLMRFPAGVAVDKAGHLYVADTMNNRIQVFSLTAV